MRRAWLRGRENLHKRYLIHVAGFNLGVLMRALYGQGTPREAAKTLYALIIVLRTEAALVFGLIATVDGELAVIVIVAADPTQTENPGLRQRAVRPGSLRRPARPRFPFGNFWAPTVRAPVTACVHERPNV